MGRLCQGVGIGNNGIGKIVEGTNTLYVFKFKDIPEILDSRNMLNFSSLWGDTREERSESNKNHNMWHTCLLPRGCRHEHSLTVTIQTYDQQYTVNRRS